MRTIDRASAFKRDYKREAKGQHRATLDSDLKPVLVALATDQPLDAKFRDHDLSGDWAGYRECHVKPDLLLIYRKSDADTLRLARLGSHSELSVEPVRLKYSLTGRQTKRRKGVRVGSFQEFPDAFGAASMALNLTRQPLACFVVRFLRRPVPC